MMPRVSLWARRATLFTGLLLTVSLTACGSSDKSDNPPNDVLAKTTASAATTAETEPTPSATPTESSFGQGLVVSICEGNGALTNTLTTYDPAGIDAVLGTTSFTVGATDPLKSIGGCGGGYDGPKTATAFNSNGQEPFTQYFVSRRETDGSNTIGYLDISGAYTSLSVPPTDDGLGKATDDEFASYHSGTNRVYYWDLAGKEPQRMSVSVQGGDNRPEADLPGANVFRSDDPQLYMPNTREPVVDTADSTAAYNTAGTVKADVWDGTLTISSASGSEIRTVNLRTHDLARSANRTVGFVPGSAKKVIITDGESLFRVDGNTITTLWENTTGKQLEDVVVARNGSIAFVIDTDAGETSLYVLTPSAVKPKRVAKITGGNPVNLLAYNLAP